MGSLRVRIEKPELSGALWGLYRSSPSSPERSGDPRAERGNDHTVDVAPVFSQLVLAGSSQAT
eukprot:3156931-Alexandrium_andersonii.AAC.1